jgi:hypothetical protein
MKNQNESLAMNMFRSYRSGRSADQLAAELSIPIDRIWMRIRAAAAYWQRHADIEPLPQAA